MDGSTFQMITLTFIETNTDDLSKAWNQQLGTQSVSEFDQGTMALGMCPTPCPPLWPWLRQRLLTSLPITLSLVILEKQ